MKKIESKICTKCNIEKYLIDFYKSKKHKLGYRNICISCCIIQRKEYIKNNIEYIREYGRERSKDYYSNNKEKCDKYYKKYSNTKHFKEYNKRRSREYYYNNRNRILQHAKIKYAEKIISQTIFGKLQNIRNKITDFKQKIIDLRVLEIKLKKQLITEEEQYLKNIHQEMELRTIEVNKMKEELKGI